MLHRREVYHERGRSKVINRRFFRLHACGQNRLLKLSDGKLPVSLTKGDQSNPSGHKISDITLQEGGQGQARWNGVPCRANSKNDGYDRLNMVFAEFFQKPVQQAIGPDLP